MAGNLLMSISQNERERAIFRSRQKFLTDLQSDLATAEDNGAKSVTLSIAKKTFGYGYAPRPNCGGYRADIC